jgi:hypothetical protein
MSLIESCSLFKGEIMLKHIFLQFMLMSILLGSAFAAQLDLGTGSGAPGAVISIPVTLTNAGASISALSTDIGYSTAVLGSPTAVIGAAATAAGKMLTQSTPSPGVLRLGILGFNTTAIADGVVATVSFTINPAAVSGVATLTNSPAATSPAGTAVAVTGTAGSITVTATDTTPPVTTASPVAGTFAAPVNVTLTANEPVTSIRYTVNGSNPVTSGIVYTGPINIATTTTLQYYATDLAGNVEATKSGVYTISHQPDLVASVSINAGANVTNSTAATLTLSATDATGVVSMRFSNDNVTYSADEPYATTKAWTLSTGDGVKTVYVRFTDGAGILYPPVIDQITLDATAPVTTATPPAGTTIGPVNVILAANETATIKYTVDGTDPVISATAVLYTVPINIATTTTLKYYATDLAGNVETVKTGLYTIHVADLVASVSINAGAALTKNTAVTLTLSATDAAGVSFMRFSNDGITYSADVAYATSAAWNLSTGDGLKTVYVRFTDGAGLLYAPVIAQITLDTTAPVTTASPVAGTFNSPLNVSLTANEAGSTIKYTIDNSDPTVSGTAVTYTGPINIATTTTLKYYATDPAGNAEAFKTGTYTISHLPDLVASVAINAGAAVTNNTAVNLTLTAMDGAGLTSVSFSNDGVTYTAEEPFVAAANVQKTIARAWTLTTGDGVKTVYVRFTDGAAVQYAAVIGQITLDTTAPVTTATPVAGTFIAPVTVSLAANEAATIRFTIDGSDPVLSATAATYTAPISVAATTTIKYYATDLAGNVETVKSGLYTIHVADLTANVTINAGAALTNNSLVNLTLVANDATGVVSMRFSNDGVNYSADEAYATSKAWTLSPGDGLKTVYVRFTDGAGMLYAPVIDQITLDTTAPVTTAAPAAGTFGTPVAVTLTANEAVTSIKYTLDGTNPLVSGTAATYAGPINIPTTKTLNYAATDLAGNVEAVKTGVYTIAPHSPDLVASVTINAGAGVTNSANVTLTLTATDGAGLSSVRFSNDGVTYTAAEPFVAAAGVQKVVDKAWILAAGDGLKTVYVEFTDAAATPVTYAAVIDQITLDTTAPVTTANPVPGTFIAPVTVTLSANEAGSTIRYTLDGSDPVASLTAATYSGPISIATTKTLKYYANDQAGNAEAVKTGVYTIHTADLVASVAINAGATVTNNTTVTLALSATDAAGVVSMRFSNDGVNYSPDEAYSTSKVWVLSNGDGVKTVYVRFTDGAGMLYDPVIAQIALDTTAPVTTATPGAGTFIASLNVTLTANEAGSTIKYTVDGSNPVTSATAVTYAGPINIAATTTINYFATDPAGNVEAPFKSTLYTIHTADLVASLTINSGATTTSSNTVTLNIAATDTAGLSTIIFSNDGVNYTAEEPFVSAAGVQKTLAKAWTLSPGDGVKTVYVKIKDGASMLYDPLVATITLNTAPQRDGRLTGGATITIVDVVRSLQIAVGLVTPSATELARGDVAPAPTYDGIIDSRDALVILQALLGMVTL